MPREKIEKEKKNIGMIIIFSAIFLFAGGVAGFFLHNAISEGKSIGRGNFQLTQAQIDGITSFFNSNPTSDEVQSYCSQNREYCFYYCRNVDSTNLICTDIINQSMSGNPGGQNA
jgi:flagellar basal body-associated protein FliL